MIRVGYRVRPLPLATVIQWVQQSHTECLYLELALPAADTDYLMSQHHSHRKTCKINEKSQHNSDL